MESIFKILTVDDDLKFLNAVQDSLKSLYEIKTASSPQEAMGAISQSQPDLVLLDYNLPGDMTGLDILKLLRRRFPDTAVIMLTGESDPDTIIETMKFGASDYVIKGTKDFESNLHFRINQAIDKIKLKRKNEELHQANISQSEQNRKLSVKLTEQAKAYEILGISKSAIKLRSDILKFKGTNTFALITGENGTGKELVARNLNLQEDDPSRPFIALNCSAISPLLFESEFFGHVKGAFTGATENKAGQFQLADGGDIFLDEVAEIPTEMQAKLLRVIQEGVFTPVGGTKQITVNVRVIAATNRDLVAEINKGTFREDLYYRLNKIQFTVSPLRERREDILFVAEELLRRSLSVGTFSDEAKKMLLAHPWRGNIRELKSTVERALILVKGSRRPEIKPEHLMLSSGAHISNSAQTVPDDLLPREKNEIAPWHFERCLNWMERLYLDRGLKIVSGDNQALYSRMGISKAQYFKRKKIIGLSGSDNEVEGEVV